MSRTMYGLYFQGSVRVVLFCSKVPSLAFTDLKPKDVLDSATERSKKERGREGLSSTFASKGRGLNRSMLRMKAAESYIRLLS